MHCATLVWKSMLKHRFFRWISKTLRLQSLDVILQMQEVKCIKPSFLRSWDLTPHGKLLIWQWKKTTMNEDVSPNKNGDFLLSGSLTPGVFYFLSGPTFLPIATPGSWRQIELSSFFRFGGGGFKDLLFSSLQYLGKWSNLTKIF